MEGGPACAMVRMRPMGVGTSRECQETEAIS